jgi:hypothetical protein
MKKFLQYHTMIWLAILMLAACKKDGPMGPEGPEGPAGNPGASGGSGGGTAGAVKVYTSDLEMDKFAWSRLETSATYWWLERHPNNSSGNHAFYVSDPNNEIPNAMILVYLNMKKGAAAPPWYNMPFLWGNMAGASEYYYANTHYLDQDNRLTVNVAATVKQVSSTSVTSPGYEVLGVRVVIIPPGATSTLRSSAPDASLTFEQIAEKYNLKEKDFLPLK